MSVNVRKLYVDSMHMTEYSNSPSDFIITLTHIIYGPDSCRFALCDIAIPHSWRATNKLCDLFYFSYRSELNNFKYLVAVQLPEELYWSTICSCYNQKAN